MLFRSCLVPLFPFFIRWSPRAERREFPRTTSQRARPPPFSPRRSGRRKFVSTCPLFRPQITGFRLLSGESRACGRLPQKLRLLHQTYPGFSSLQDICTARGGKNYIRTRLVHFFSFGLAACKKAQQAQGEASVARAAVFFPSLSRCPGFTIKQIFRL